MTHPTDLPAPDLPTKPIAPTRHCPRPGKVRSASP